ncbi:hypothetical protein [Prescottella agglutinans]|uniref:Uncharacterized protein n=1 Tax=Prescottella agglutinans TaxID=1644129 RepID=A0ABT6M5E0_9NOCA|nr:hypothetical protein [Prescottella agglutinans]MDH6279510.1 hypothetical protein [Prescottella agglutinans]
MSQRDELANLIDDAIGWAGQEDIALEYHVADAILAAGYSSPRVVETIEELEALPVWSVVRDRRKYTLERCDHGWFIPGRAGYRDARDIAIPATVLYVPEEAK